MQKRTALMLASAVFVAFQFCSAYASVDDEDSDQVRRIQESLQRATEKPPEIIIEEIIQAKRPRPVLPEGKTPIKHIAVTGATVVSDTEINAVIAPFQGRDLTGDEMQKCADLITDLYTRKGYITSYAYVLPEKIKEGILQIAVQEVTIGSIEIKGNKYFKSSVIGMYVTMKKGEVFNAKKLQKDVYKINKNRDRKAHFLIRQGKEPGTVDIVLMIKDKWPFHTLFEVDNYGSEYILYRRYKTYITHSNISGHDDSLQFKYQRTDAGVHKLYDFDYFIPLNDKWKFELYVMPYKDEDYLYSDNEDKDFEKHAKKWYFYFYQSLIDEPNFELVSSYGFVYKDIVWYQYGQRAAWDRFRALMWGLDLNRADKYGRWVISNDLEIGIPRMWGGNSYEDDACSVDGAGGGYKKNHLIVARRQNLFAGIEFLGKAHWQLSSHAQPGVNVFSVGGFMGVIDMRGYPRAQAPGDRGYSFTGGFSFPAYFVPRNIGVPMSKAKLYDALKLFTFFDWATATLKDPGDNGDKSTTLSSAGCGLTFTLPENFSARLDIGWPLRETRGKDGDHAHAWFRVTKGY